MTVQDEVKSEVNSDSDKAERARSAAIKKVFYCDSKSATLETEDKFPITLEIMRFHRQESETEREAALVKDEIGQGIHHRSFLVFLHRTNLVLQLGYVLGAVQMGCASGGNRKSLCGIKK
ncbi:hypothetical protein I3843_11G094100 [Carya illinoinensis]|nr:hypothetical protein I3760_11G092900 [Carya illinoinensis]KAG7955835.1 hypothetical protein I3843_11G094100 [Carya illinoinensis]